MDESPYLCFYKYQNFIIATFHMSNTLFRNDPAIFFS